MFIMSSDDPDLAVTWQRLKRKDLAFVQHLRPQPIWAGVSIPGPRRLAARFAGTDARAGGMLPS
jgi:hypothetical protein